MRLGLNLGYWSGDDGVDSLTLAGEAERLGLSVCWVAEAYGSDAPTVLAWIAARTERIGLGSAVMQIPARTPATTAMTAATLDALSGGRFSLGLGVSGPQVSEGWHGVRFTAPLARTEEYVEIVRAALRRERVEFSGEHYELPLPGGPGKPLKLTLRPVRPRIPVYLAAVGPRNQELAGRVADGWLASFFSPEHAQEQLEPVRRGRRLAAVPEAAAVPVTGNEEQREGDDALEGFDVVASVPVSFGDDLAAAAEPVRAYIALYVGGMGSRDRNFYHALACRMGFEAEADRIQDLYLDRRYAEAAAAVPLELVDATSLIGPQERVADRIRAFAEAGVTTLALTPFADGTPARVDVLRRSAAAYEASGVAA